MSNEEASRLFDHGIGTSVSDYWVHYHPLEKKVYWYRVDQMRRYIKRKKIPETIGRSADGSASGAGYLVPKMSHLISSAKSPAMSNLDWNKMSDREAGLLGQEIVDVFIERGVIRFSSFMTKHVSDSDQQYKGVDFELSWFRPLKIEVKTERKISENLFVQSRERNHQVHQVRGVGGQYETVETKADWET
jgi:hypothetical protein